ncbi:reverse transcriptase domain-containing protein [Tanacetum coccineum]
MRRVQKVGKQRNEYVHTLRQPQPALLFEIYGSVLRKRGQRRRALEIKIKEKKPSRKEDDLSQPWCDMFNSTLTGNARVWFDDLPAQSIDNYDDLKKAFLENYLQQKKYIKDPIELHNIKQRDGESTEDFVRRYKLESRYVKGVPECMRIFGFVHGITNPELIKRLHDKIPKTVDEMVRVTTSFLWGEVAAPNHERKKSFRQWRQQEVVVWPSVLMENPDISTDTSETPLPSLMGSKYFIETLDNTTSDPDRLTSNSLINIS